MITIEINKKACVGCALCIEACPTGVFVFNNDKGIPEVVRQGECFGCLSCSEICPSDAIVHEGIQLSEAYYCEPHAISRPLKAASAVQDRWSMSQNPEGVRKALADLGVRLLSVASIFKQTLGDGLPAIGTLAGRTLAVKFYHHQIPKLLNETIKLARQQFSPAWEIEPELEGKNLTIGVKDCIVRDLCKQEGIELGGELCILFYNYLAGFIGCIGGVRPRLIKALRSWKGCMYEARIRS